MYTISIALPQQQKSGSLLSRPYQESEVCPRELAMSELVRAEHYMERKKRTQKQKMTAFTDTAYHSKPIPAITTPIAESTMKTPQNTTNCPSVRPRSSAAHRGAAYDEQVEGMALVGTQHSQDCDNDGYYAHYDGIDRGGRDSVEQRDTKRNPQELHAVSTTRTSATKRVVPHTPITQASTMVTMRETLLAIPKQFGELLMSNPMVMCASCWLGQLCSNREFACSYGRK